MADNNAELAPIKDHHGQKVIDAYFDGDPPFAAIKNKKDFPDAYIWENIYDLINEVDILHVVCNDGGLKKACESQEKIEIYNNLDKFIKSDKCHEKLRDIYFEEKLPEIISILKTKIPFLKEQLDGILLNQLPGYTFEDYNIPDDNNEAMVSSVDEAGNLEIDFEKMEYYGEGFIVIPFRCNVEVYADYYIFKGDYYCLPEERIRDIGVFDHNDHYYRAEETFNLEIQGSLSIVFDISGITESEQIIKEIDQLLENAAIDLEDMGVSLSR